MFFPQLPAWVNQLIEIWLHAGVPAQVALAFGFALGCAFVAVLNAAANAVGNGR